MAVGDINCDWAFETEGGTTTTAETNLAYPGGTQLVVILKTMSNECFWLCVPHLACRATLRM